MKFRKPSRRQIVSSCSDLGAEDGADPRTFFRKSSRKRTNRKALQLCSQIARTLSAVLAWESDDDLLRCLVVESVEPAPDSSRVLVSVSTPDANSGPVLERLQERAGRLRMEAAASIHRKRAPELVFHVCTRGEERR